MLDFLHTFSYVGTGTFPDYNYYANQLWIIGRLVESISIALYASINWDRVRIPHSVTFVVYGSLTLLGALAVLVFRIFPAAFIAGQGQTTFKVFSGYGVIIILLLAAIIMHQKRHHYDSQLYRYLVTSIFLTIFSEMAFTLYTDNYGVSNVIGHLLKILSFYLIYRSVIVNVLQRPYQLLFADLAQKEQTLRQAVETKDRFFKIIAHDLRSPFNVIINLSEFLTNLGEQTNNPEIQKYTRHIHETSSNTFRLLENLLTWAQMQTNQITYQPRQTDVAQLIDETLKLKRLVAGTKHITINDPEGPTIQASCDPEMIQTIIRNLLSNAIKFTPEHGQIWISTMRQDNHWGFQVRDSGIGIPPQLQAEIFSFRQNLSRPGTNGEKGTGLGLILCREFAELHNGRLEIESTPNAGCTVRCIIPDNVSA